MRFLRNHHILNDFKRIVNTALNVARLVYYIWENIKELNTSDANCRHGNQPKDEMKCAQKRRMQQLSNVSLSVSQPVAKGPTNERQLPNRHKKIMKLGCSVSNQNEIVYYL